MDAQLLTVGVGVLVLAGALVQPRPEPVGRVFHRGEAWVEAAAVAPAPPPWLPDGAELRWAGPAPACPTPADARLPLNSASRSQLEALPGIGPALAGRILAGRPYRRVEDLDRVKGIGPATLARLRSLVRP